MPASSIAHLFITADTNDILSSHPQLKNAGPGTYLLWIMSAAAADGTWSFNDGKTPVVSAEPIPVRAAAVTYPEIKVNEDLPTKLVVVQGLRPIIDIVDGTNCEIAVKIQKVG